MECSICLETAQLYTLRPCLHQCLCLTCLSQLALKFLTNGHKIHCPLCRAQVKWIYDVSISDLHTLCKESGTALYATIKTAITHRKLQTVTDIVYSMFADLLKENPSCLPFMTWKQTEELINLAHIKHSEICGNEYATDAWKFAYVSACITPWNVKNGGSGLCYQGNLGDKPEGLIIQLYLLRSNMAFLLNRQTRH